MKIKKILVSQPQPTAKSPYYEIAKKHDVEIVFRPMIKVEPLTVKEFRHSKINLSEYTAVIFTARTAVDNFFRLCEESRVTVPDTMRYFCTTEQIALYLQKYIVYRKRKISYGLTGRLDDPQFLAAVQKNHKEKFLMPVSDIMPERMEALAAMNIDLTPAMMYRTVSNDFRPDEKCDYDLMLFFSPVGIHSLLKNVPDFVVDGKQKALIGTFGAPTAHAVKESGLELSIEAPTKDLPSMTSALDDFLTRHNAQVS
ncbi:MAG: uroporphyrinogen-III synthase [Muribaculaceae bacterium]|nr:uroporphyrinogen-III synthase [Muribaculaceae bacterium]